ncbi:MULTISPECIES: hydroxymyristoyl-ACP dehydratase [unclassified Zunongwangia]|uniref:hydroxymyristoyl-ACP dehydratase n=1 Tax=unclassified Zunongwangia TaxID=2632541 RepID=UPI0022DE392C|nr:MULTISPECIES: hydroxymyristoyl-ACP dehydratase [unclassified Zunongwangia]WBL20845.1 hydroxymyristoyl-ACP dehydratase [Zunongwangia sp. HRR-M8]WBL27278.1 hydroxymyristoyl-ACP dehydratase [Zunongwangia sp. HGR-M22]
MLLKDFYKVLESSKEEETFVTKISIEKSHSLYAGHFPDRPVTPGVILMHLFKEEAERRTNKNLALIKATNVKFMAVVDPNTSDKVILETKIIEENGITKVQGVAKQNDALALKFNALYKAV